MGCKLCIPQEQRSVERLCDCRFPGVEFRDFKFPQDNGALSKAFIEFQKKACGRNLETIRSYPIDHRVAEISDYEIYLMALIQDEKAKIQLAVLDGNVIGFLLFHVLAECVLFIRGIFLFKEFEGHGIGEDLINSLGKPIRKIIFQTNLHLEPTRVLEYASRFAAQPIYKSSDAITWEMTWQHQIDLNRKDNQPQE